jgi:acyl transferase domain-containing protein
VSNFLPTSQKLGLSLCAPGGESGGLDVEEFHEFLKNRGSGIITVPPYRWNAEAYHGTAPGQSCTVSSLGHLASLLRVGLTSIR